MNFSFLPVCRVCGERHRVGQCLMVKALAETVGREAEQVLREALPVKQRRKYDRNVYHRNYMREYMKRRRAAGKANGGV